MQSKRKRAAERREETAAQLLQSYRDECPVSRDGEHGVLRWLVMARCYEPLDDVPECPLDSANATPWVPTMDEFESMEQAVATRVMAEERSLAYLQYATAFFRWWHTISVVASGPKLGAIPAACEWLSTHEIERSLVVPDVRRSAIAIAQKLSVRAGEFDVASDYRGGRTRTVSTILQALRTGEWNTRLHHTLMYGRLASIYRNGLLDMVCMAIVDGRYRGRLNFTWVDNVLISPSTLSITPGAWPLIYVHGSHYMVSWHGSHMICPDCRSAYGIWLQLCLDHGGILGGRYDVRKCTI